MVGMVGTTREAAEMAAAPRQENIKWVDGLRGIASLLVVATHVTRSFDDSLYRPVSHEGGSAKFLQLPLARVLIQGRLGVPIFSLVTGYVCALKPLRLLNSGQQEKALKSIAISAFRRVPRLVIPTWIVTVLIWACLELGLMNMPRHVASMWLIYSTPTRSPFVASIPKLLYSLTNTFIRQVNLYEPNQWTLLPLLKGAFLVYMMLMATSSMKQKYRLMVELGMFCYYYAANDPEFGIHFFLGAFLCELSQYQPYLDWVAVRKWPSRYLGPVLIFIGLCFASYPGEKAEWAAWSNNMTKISKYIFTPGHQDKPRWFSGFGLIWIALGIHFSDSAKAVLSHKDLLFFGKHSFAVYLIHGLLMRTVLTWALYGITYPSDIILKDGTKRQPPHVQMCGWPRRIVVFPLFFVLLYYLAHLWGVHVDGFAARVTKRVEDRMFKDKEQIEKPLLPTTPPVTTS